MPATLLLWLNTAGVFGLPDTTGYAFQPQETPNWPDDYVVAEGEALSLALLHVNNDLFPDIAYGTRSSVLYTGDIYILPATARCHVQGQKINQTQRAKSSRWTWRTSTRTTGPTSSSGRAPRRRREGSSPISEKNGEQAVR